jgi:hypothetical protein
MTPTEEPMSEQKPTAEAVRLAEEIRNEWYKAAQRDGGFVDHQHWFNLGERIASVLAAKDLELIAKDEQLAAKDFEIHRLLKYAEQNEADRAQLSKWLGLALDGEKARRALLEEAVNMIVYSTAAIHSSQSKREVAFLSRPDVVELLKEVDV